MSFVWLWCFWLRTLVIHPGLRFFTSTPKSIAKICFTKTSSNPGDGIFWDIYWITVGLRYKRIINSSKNNRLRKALPHVCLRWSWFLPWIPQTGLPLLTITLLGIIVLIKLCTSTVTIPGEQSPTLVTPHNTTLLWLPVKRCLCGGDPPEWWCGLCGVSAGLLVNPRAWCFLYSGRQSSLVTRSLGYCCFWLGVTTLQPCAVISCTDASLDRVRLNILWVTVILGQQWVLNAA